MCIIDVLSSGTESGFEHRGQSMNQKNFKWHGLLKKKKKIMVNKRIALYYHEYLSQKGNNMNKKKLKVTIWYSNIFEEEE